MPIQRSSRPLSPILLAICGSCFGGLKSRTFCEDPKMAASQGGGGTLQIRHLLRRESGGPLCSGRWPTAAIYFLFFTNRRNIKSWDKNRTPSQHWATDSGHTARRTQWRNTGPRYRREVHKLDRPGAPISSGLNFRRFRAGRHFPQSLAGDK